MKDHNGQTGRGIRKWKCFDQIDAILGHRPATAHPIVLDTSTDEVQVPDSIPSFDMQDNTKGEILGS